MSRDKKKFFLDVIYISIFIATLGFTIVNLKVTTENPELEFTSIKVKLTFKGLFYNRSIFGTTKI